MNVTWADVFVVITVLLIAKAYFDKNPEQWQKLKNKIFGKEEN